MDKNDKLYGMIWGIALADALADPYKGKISQNQKIEDKIGRAHV